MTRIKYIFSLILILNFGFSFSQEMNEFEIESRNKADLVFNKVAESQSTDLPYVLLSIGNSDYIITIDRKTHYTQIIAVLKPNDNVEIVSVKSIKKTDKILEKAFDSSMYAKDFIGFKSDFFKDGYESASGGTTYFVLKDGKRQRFGESSLSVIVKPNPIDPKVYGYLVSELINRYN